MDTTPDLAQITTRDDLAELIEGRTDDDIVEVVTTLGVDAVLAQIAQAMVDRFDAERAAGDAALIQWDVVAADGIHSFHLDVADGACTTGAGPADSPRVAIQLALVDFLRLIAGKLEAMGAFMAGKLKITGDLMFAQTMQVWFGV